jgi:hypothetical protein
MAAISAGVRNEKPAIGGIFAMANSIRFAVLPRLVEFSRGK